MSQPSSENDEKIWQRPEYRLNDGEFRELNFGGTKDRKGSSKGSSQG